MGKKTSDFRVGLWPGDHYESTCNRGKDTCSINVANTVDFLKITHQYNRLDEHRDEVVYFSVGQDVVELFRAKRGETTTWRYQPY